MVGVKSTALRFGSLTKNWITGFAIACIGNLALSGYNAELGTHYLLCAIPYNYLSMIFSCTLMNACLCFLGQHGNTIHFL